MRTGRALGNLLLMSATLLLAGLLHGGCDFTVTNELPTYDELDPEEKQAVDIIVAELTELESHINSATGGQYDLAPVVDRNHIDVSFEGVIITINIGDGQVHVATWENLTDDQQALVQLWFKAPTLEAAQQTYETLFYKFLAASQGAKQFLYNALTSAWVFGHRSVFNVERDSIRTALSFYVAAGRKAEMWTFVDQACAPIISQYGATYASTFGKAYLNEHFTELADSKAPTGYMYYICRWIAMGKDDVESLPYELDWLLQLKED